MKILFLDIDGTVLSHSSGSVPASALLAIRMVQERGIKVYACTGRHTKELQSLPLHDLQPDGWITTNGALNYLNDGTVLSEYPIADEDLHVLYEALVAHPFPVQFLEKEDMYVNMHSAIVEEGLKKIHSVQDPVKPLQRILNHPVYMFIPWVEESRFHAIQLKFKHTHCTRWNSYAVDCFHIHCGKSQGIEDVLIYYGFSSEEACSIGDGENDLSMFAVCGKNIAMGNACDNLKKQADYITSDIDNDGLYKAVQYLLKMDN